MADKTISELAAATSVGSADLFVLEQANTAKKLTGQILENWLVSFADGHGGIQSIALVSSTGTNPVIDTYRITLADTTTFDFTVTNGLKGDTGASTYVWIKWAAQQPTADNQMSDNPDDWIGIYTGLSSTAPTSYTSYSWYDYKGEKGDTGETGASIATITRTGGDGSPGTYDTYTVTLDNGTIAGTFMVWNGVNGTGAVNSVNSVNPDATGNVNLTPASIGAAPVPLHLTGTLTALPATLTNAAITATMRVVECTFGTPSAVTSDIAWTTAAGNMVLSGTMSGSTTVDIILIETT